MSAFRTAAALGVVASLLALPIACGSENTITPPDVIPPAGPPEDDPTEQGDPPNFVDCDRGYFATYYNLDPTHPAMEPQEASLPGVDPTTLDWWDDSYQSFEKYDPSLEFGANWWPVDEGVDADPAYYSVKWNAWLRAVDDGDVSFVLAAGTDAWVLLNGEVIASIEGAETYTTLEFSRYIDTGVMPLEIRFAHRTGTAGFRFRVVQGDVIICFPDFGND